MRNCGRGGIAGRGLVSEGGGGGGGGDGDCDCELPNISPPSPFIRPPPKSPAGPELLASARLSKPGGAVEGLLFPLPQKDVELLTGAANP